MVVGTNHCNVNTCMVQIDHSYYSITSVVMMDDLLGSQEGSAEALERAAKFPCHLQELAEAVL